MLVDWHAASIERLDEGLDRLAGLDPRDAGLARELTYGALRHGRLYDALAERFLRRGSPPDVLRAALRLVCHQLFALDRVPPHAALHDTIEALRSAGHRHLVPVANAVSRRLADLRTPERTCDGPLGRLAARDQPEDLAVRLGLPSALIDDLREVVPSGLGREAAFAALNRVPHLCTRTRAGKPVPQGASILKRDGDWTWWDDPQEPLRGPVPDGICVVQDRTQGDVVALSAARPGDLVLDVCAAPGGKSLALVDRGCRVVSADVSLEKTRKLQGLPLRLAQDGTRPALVAGFDVVLVDAPCSNSGVLARRVEARWRYDRKHLDSLAKLQRALIRAAATLVAPGGRLVYSTCSLNPQENQGIAHALEGWRLLGEHLTWPDEWRGGGYAASLVRQDAR